MAPYKLSNAAKIDLARIYWHGVERFGELQADHYYEILAQRFIEIAESPYKYPLVDHIRAGYRRSVCGVDSIYYRINNGVVEVMRILGRQEVTEKL